MRRGFDYSLSPDFGGEGWGEGEKPMAWRGLIVRALLLRGETLDSIVDFHFSPSPQPSPPTAAPLGEREILSGDTP
jgi:hypothetical protein